MTTLLTASLSERGLLTLEVVEAAGAIAALAAGLVIGRWFALVVAPLLVGVAFAGVAAGWWGAGFTDRWPFVFVVMTVLAALLTAVGVAGHLALRRRLPPAALHLRGAVLAAALGGVVLSWFLVTRTPDVESLQARTPAPIYYLGDSFEGYRLSHAEVGQGRAFLVYGDCEHAIGHVDGGCSPPIQLQQEFPLGGGEPRERVCPRPEPARVGGDPYVVFAGATMIKVFARGREESRRVVAALRPVPGACPQSDRGAVS